VEILNSHLLLNGEHRVAFGAVASDLNRVEAELIQVVIPQAGWAGDGQLSVRAAVLGALLVAMSLITGRAQPALRNLRPATPLRIVLVVM